ncbi:hypothetical protein Dsin_026150 [Dipteronia sinensis]|uniref:Uncharacterized protein n=1 Tax=Dipteronia sinensis TaxID=43782 RepID=A0AAD9ZX06_9ROSI|nr:hypothetical protein Dsin_026150 [Dipteronia sinensis]
MFEFTINRAIDLKSALMLLTCLAPTATIINSAKAVSLLHSVDIEMLIGFLNVIGDENIPLAMGAAVEDYGGRLTVKTSNIGNTPYTFFNMGLIQANDQHINFFHQERTYDVKVGML